MSLAAEDWAPLFSDVAAAPVVTHMAQVLWRRGWLSGRASMGDQAALHELADVDPLAARLVALGLVASAELDAPIDPKGTS